MSGVMRSGMRVCLMCGLSVFAIGLLAGCHSAPERVSVYDYAADEQVEVASTDYWSKDLKVRSDLGRRARRTAGPVPGDRVVISEFAVEFVQEKLETPFDSQLAAAPATPVTIGFSLLGLGRVQIDFAEEDYEQIATHAYELFVRELESAGLVVLPHEACSECALFDTLAAASGQRQSSVLQKFNAFATDTGRIKEIRTVAPAGMQLLETDGAISISTAEQSVREEAGVDWVLRARMRVGIYRGLLSVEQDSRVVATGEEATLTLKARRSLLSPRLAVDPKEFEAFRGDVFRINTRRFVGSLDSTLPTYVRMAILRSRLSG